MSYFSSYTFIFSTYMTIRTRELELRGCLRPWPQSKANWGLTGLEFDTSAFLSFGHYPRIWFFLSVLYKKVKTLTILLTLQLKNETFYCLFRISADPQCLKINQNVSFEFFNFSIFRQYCLHRIAMFGNIVWPHSSGFQKIVKLTLVRFS